MNTKELREKKSKLSLSQFQKDVLVGLLLGDGHLETQNFGRTYRLKVEHSIMQLEYTKWLSEIFSGWITGMYEKTKNGKKYVGFTTYSHPAFRFYAHQFYQEKKKIIPLLIHKLITDTSFAIWYLDDGSWKSKKHSTFIIHTLGFSKKDLERIVKILNDKNVKSKLHSQKNKYWRLYILSESSDNFKKIIFPIVSKFESMKHKIGNIEPKK